MNSYSLTSAWFKWVYDNPEKIKPIHHALYFYCIELCNSLKWKPKFGLPTKNTMEIIGVSNFKTYYDCLSDLVSFGFIKIIEKSKNQYSTNIISLIQIVPSNVISNVEAQHKHSSSTVDINKHIKTIKTNKKEEEKFIPPTYQEVWEYFYANGYLESAAKKAFEYYNTAKWVDSRGNKVRNWKQKMISVWFKDENKKEERGFVC